jgi:hypothetical protein
VVVAVWTSVFGQRQEARGAAMVTLWRGAEAWERISRRLIERREGAAAAETPEPDRPMYRGMSVNGKRQRGIALTQ